MTTYAAALLSLIAGLSAVSHSAASQTERAASAISGVVVDATTRAPIGGALVTVQRPGDPKPRVVTTSGDGKFLVDHLPAGAYVATIRRAGYFAGAFGRRWLNDVPSSLLLRDDDTAAATVLMFPTAAIVGTVRDDADEPVVQMPVRAFQRTFRGGVEQFTIAAMGETDDRGAYRLYDLPPGDFLVAAMPRQPRGWARMYPATFFPSASEPSTATTITLALGDVRRSADIRVSLVASANIAGTLVEPDGMPAARTVALRPRWADAFGDNIFPAIYSTKGGSFLFTGVPPGPYTIGTGPMSPGSQASGAPPPRWGSTAVNVDAANITGLKVFLHDALTISGRIVFDGASDTATPPAQRARIGVAPMNSLLGTPLVTISSDGRTFEIAPCEPGAYLLAPFSTDAAYALKSVTAQGQDVTGRPVVLTPHGIDDVVITFTDRPPLLTAAVTGPGADGPLAALVLPADAARRRTFGEAAPLVRKVIVSNARLEVRDLPPGDYLIAVVPEEQTADWPQAQAIDRASRLGTAVHLDVGSAVALDLKVVSLR